MMTLVRRSLELKARRACTVTESNRTDADATATGSSQWWCQTRSVSMFSSVSVEYVASIHESSISETCWGVVVVVVYLRLAEPRATD